MDHRRGQEITSNVSECMSRIRVCRTRNLYREHEHTHPQPWFNLPFMIAYFHRVFSFGDHPFPL